VTIAKSGSAASSTATSRLSTVGSFLTNPPGTVAFLRTLKARQAADRLALGVGYRDSG
jgi:hypothetical protein